MGEEKSVDVDLEWLGGKKSTARIRGFTVQIDNPKKEGGEDTGPKPTELLLASLGSCFAIGFAYFAKKMKLDLKGVRLRVSGFKSGDEENPRFTHINISVHPEVEGVDYPRLQRLSELAEKYCTVENTLKNRTDVSIQILSERLFKPSKG